MKLFAASLLAASAITFASASTCQSPIVSNGQCIGFIKKKFKRVDCSSRSATVLKIDADGKLCSGGGKRKKCLARRYRKRKTKSVFRMSSKIKGSKMEYVKFSYDAANNQLKVTAPNDQANKYPVFDKDVKLTLSDTAEDVGCTVGTTAAPTTAAPTTAAPTTAAPTTAAPTTAAPTTKIENACFPEDIFKNGDEGWQQYDKDRWFKKESNNVSVTDAQNHCESSYGGSNLATIDSTHLAKWMQDNMDIKDKHWVGAAEPDTRIFHWQDGTKVDDSLWDKVEPNNYKNLGERCVSIFPKNNTWGQVNLNDGPCNYSYRFICEGEEPLDEVELNSFKERPETENAMVWYNKLYVSITTKKPWAEALEYCNNNFNTLAKVDNLTLITWFQASDGLNNNVDEFYWVGGNEIRNFAWNDGTSVDNAVWHDDKPNNFDEKCVEVFDNGARVGLNDVECSKTKAFICERNC